MFRDILSILLFVFVFLTLATAMTSLFIRTPYVPSKKRVIDKLLKIADLKKNEKLIDLGCGDGRLLFEAEKKYSSLVEGYEIAPLVYLFAKIKKTLLRSKAQLHFKNFFGCDLSSADTITCYLTPAILKKLKPKLIKECKKGTKILTHTFHIEGLSPIQTYNADKKKKIPIIYLYKI